MSHTTALTQLRVFVPADRPAAVEFWEEYLCNNYGGFSVNPSERIKGAWRNPVTGKVDYDIMAVYYVWVDWNRSERQRAFIIKTLGDTVRRIYGETAASVIHDSHVHPMIVG